MNEAEKLAFVIETMTQIRDCSERGMAAEEYRQWQYLEEVISAAAYALRKLQEKK